MDCLGRKNIYYPGIQYIPRDWFHEPWNIRMRKPEPTRILWFMPSCHVRVAVAIAWIISPRFGVTNIQAILESTTSHQLGWIFQKSVPTLQTGANSLGYHQKACDSVTLTFSNVQPGHMYERWNSRKGQYQTKTVKKQWFKVIFYPLVGGHQRSRINIPKKVSGGLLSQTLNVWRIYLHLPPKLATCRQLDQHQWESGYILKIKLCLRNLKHVF